MNRTAVLNCFCSCFTITAPIHAQQSPPGGQGSSLLSPDKQWEYQPAADNEDPKIVKAGTNKIGVSFADDCQIGCAHARVLWAPNSTRFAFICGDGKTRETFLYQLRGDEWVKLRSLGEDDEIEHRAYNIVKAQAKRDGLPKNTFLHMQWSTVEANRWIDSSTLTVYASLAMRVHRNNGEDVGLGYGTDLLVTLKLDKAGNSKIVKSHGLSEKEAEKFQQQE